MWNTFTPSSIPKPPPDAVVARARELTKRFGRHVAVDRLDLEIRAGEVFGLLGPSGAGKSTILSMLLGLVAPTGGEVTVFDRNPARDPLPHPIGGLIESPALYPFLTGRECLEALALATGGIPVRSMTEVLKLVDLGETADRRVETYSADMRQRLGIAAALLDDPALVLLDEPTRDLEPPAQREIRRLIPQLARQGRAVIVASRRLDDMAQVCDRMTVLRHGQAMATGWVDELLRDSDAAAILPAAGFGDPAAAETTKRRHVADAA